MTERYPPNYRPKQKTLNLGDVLRELGHTPESFARVIGRNASGLRRAIRGETAMTPSAVRDVIEGLYAEGWKGDPSRIVQFRNAPASAVYVDRMMAETQSVASRPTSASQAAVSRALAELMRAVGREEVDRVYTRVFGASPGSPDKKE